MINLGTNTSATSLQTASSQAGVDRILRSADAAGQAALSGKQEKAAEAAKDFEAVFIAEMLKPMFETIEVDDTFGGGHGEEVFRGLMVQEYGKMLSQKGGIGLATHIQAQLLKLQEKGTAA